VPSCVHGLVQSVEKQPLFLSNSCWVFEPGTYICLNVIDLEMGTHCMLVSITEAHDSDPARCLETILNIGVLCIRAFLYDSFELEVPHVPRVKANKGMSSCMLPKIVKVARVFKPLDAAKNRAK
jgi:hypothetical protein